MALLDAVGAVVGVVALGLGAWQLRVAILDRRDTRNGRAAADGDPATGVDGALPVAVPLGRLPVEVLGRDALLAELNGSLGGNWRRRRPGAWVLAGLGGIGKSTVALRLAAEARRRGRPVWWVNAADPLSLRGGVLEVLRQLGAPDAVAREVREGTPTAADRFWTFLDGTAKRALLIFDNADEPAVLAADGMSLPGDGTGWIRPGGGVLVVVTTRTSDPRTWGSWAQVRVLKALDDESAADVLRGLAPGVEDPTGREAMALAKRLGALPLALHLAGTYLASPFARWHGFADYQRALDSVAAPEAIADLDTLRTDSRAAVSRTWELSLDALAAQGLVRARRLLYLLSCLAPATPIPGSLLRLEADNDAREFTAALRGLAEVGLIDVADAPVAGHRDVVVHPVVADICRTQVLTTQAEGGGTVMAAAVRLLSAAGGELDSEHPGDRSAWERLLPHVAAAVSWMASHLETENLITLLKVSLEGFRSLWYIGRLASRDAEALARANLAAAERLGDEHPDALAARHNLGIQLGAAGAAHEAEEIFRAVLAGRRRVLGEDQVDTLLTRDQLIGAIMEQGRFAETEPMYRELIADMTRVLGADHRETLTTSVDLAWCIGMQGRPVEAAEICRRALERDRRILGEEDPRTLDAWDDLTRWTNEQGNHAAAEQMCRELLNIELRVMGTEHQLTLTTQMNLARAVANQGRLNEAEPLLREALADMERVLGEAHYRSITARRYLADAVAARGQTGEAMRIYRHVLDLQQRRLGHEHPETLATRQLVAETTSM